MNAKEMFEVLGFGVRKTKEEIIIEDDLEKYTFDLRNHLLFIDNKGESFHRLYLTVNVSEAINKMYKELGWVE